MRALLLVLFACVSLLTIAQMTDWRYRLFVIGVWAVITALFVMRTRKASTHY